MKRFLLSILFLQGIFTCFAQTDKSKDLFAFRITDYQVKLNDSTVIVQVDLSNGGISIAEGQVGVLKANSNADFDTTNIGWGKCHLIKGTYYYFVIHLRNNKRLPKKNDLVFAFVNYPAIYKGRIFGLIRNDIYLQRVTEGAFYTPGFSLFGDQDQENSILDSLAADIRYTGKEILKMAPERDMPIATGRYKDKKILTAMQDISASEVKDFIDYLLYRPTRYAGNNWKISEVFATWMNSGAPAAVK